MIPLDMDNAGMPPMLKKPKKAKEYAKVQTYWRDGDHFYRCLDCGYTGGIEDLHQRNQCRGCRKWFGPKPKVEKLFKADNKPGFKYPIGTRVKLLYWGKGYPAPSMVGTVAFHKGIFNKHPAYGIMVDDPKTGRPDRVDLPEDALSPLVDGVGKMTKADLNKVRDAMTMNKALFKPGTLTRAGSALQRLGMKIKGVKSKFAKPITSSVGGAVQRVGTNVRLKGANEYRRIKTAAKLNARSVKPKTYFDIERQSFLEPNAMNLKVEHSGLPTPKRDWTLPVIFGTAVGGSLIGTAITAKERAKKDAFDRKMKLKRQIAREKSMGKMTKSAKFNTSCPIAKRLIGELASKGFAYLKHPRFKTSYAGAGKALGAAGVGGYILGRRKKKAPMMQNMEEYEGRELGKILKNLATAAQAGRKAFIAGVRASMKAKNPAQQAMAHRWKTMGRTLVNRAAKTAGGGMNEGADVTVRGKKGIIRRGRRSL